MRLPVCIALLSSSFAAAQVTGTFSLEKSVYAHGEPVFLNLTMTNRGEQAVEVVTSDPYSFCSGYDIQIVHEGTPRLNCARGFGGSCMSGAITLAPHASRTERILLNYQNTSRGDLNPPVSLPGNYTIDASRALAFAPAGIGSAVFNNPETYQVHQVMSLRVDDSSEASAAVFAPFVQQLSSPDVYVRSDAARTLATLAPAALEPLLLSFAVSKDEALREEAPLALSNLGTPASLDAMARLLQSALPGSYESMTAGEYLGRTHDPKWLPLLLEIADQNNGLYFGDAAESGGDTALPQLLLQSRSQNASLRGSAIYALGSSRSRAAVPLLIEILRAAANRSGEDAANEATSANAALQQLTHRYIEREQSDNWVQTAVVRWQAWWTASGRDAKVYFPEECVEDVPLP